jgi:chromosome segregation protein
MSFAYWRKSDLQVHTPRDPNWKGKRPLGLGDELSGAEATLDDVDAARAAWAEEFIEQCHQRGLDAVAITDHHEMVMVPYVQRAIEARKQHDQTFDLWLFPGMELTCHGGVQCLLIFDADLPVEWLGAAQAKLGIVAATLNESSRQGPPVTQLDIHYPDIGDKLASVKELKGRYIVLPNVSQGGHHTVLTTGSHSDFKRMSYVGGYLDNGQNVESLGGANLRRLSGRDAAWGSRYVYPLPTSDARSVDYAQLGTNQCWIKFSTPTAEALRQAFLGHKSRISIVRPVTTGLSIKSVTIGGSKILADGETAISPELNALIGGRGSGKSTFLEYIAFGLGRSCHDIEKPEYSGTGRLAGVIKDTLITPSATLDIVVVQDGATFDIRRSGATSYNPKITYPDGTSEILTLKELRSLFPAVVYSQGELSEIGKQAGKRAQLSDLLQFVDLEFKREDERLNAEIESAKLAVRKAVPSLSTAWTQEAQLHKLQTGKSSLEQRIIALQKTLPELPEADRAHVAKYHSLVELQGERQLAEKQAKSVMDEFGELWRTSRQPVDINSPLPDAVKIQAAYREFNSLFAAGVEKLGKELAVQREKILAAGAEIGATFEVSKIERDRVMEKLTEHRSVTVQIAKLQNELQIFNEQMGDLEASRLLPDVKIDELQKYVDDLKSAVAVRAVKTKEWADKIETLSNNRIEAQLTDDGNWSEILEAVDALAAKTGSQEGIRHQRIAERIEHDGVWGFLDAIRGDCLAALRWKQVSTSGGGDKPICETLSGTIGATDRMLAQCIELIDLQRVEAISIAVPKPEITLFYCDGDHRISFEKASEGQRAAALLFMLLEQPGGPLIVDQPEGDLDNKIVSELAEKLHSAKQHRQIIFASHNANIVVNGSSELVVGMDVTPDAKRAVACCGAIDQNAVCLKITETMEGGEKAFRDRKDKYGY